MVRKIPVPGVAFFPLILSTSPELKILPGSSINIWITVESGITLNLCSDLFSSLVIDITHMPRAALDGILKSSILKVPILSENVSNVLITVLLGSEIFTFSIELLPVLPIIRTCSPGRYSLLVVWNSIGPEPVDRPTVKIVKPLALPCLISTVNVPVPMSEVSA